MWTLSAKKIIDKEENVMKKKSEFEVPKIEVIMFFTSESVGTFLTTSETPSGKWEEEDDWIDPENNTY